MRERRSSAWAGREDLTRNAVRDLFRLRRYRLAFLALDSYGFHFL